MSFSAQNASFKKLHTENLNKLKQINFASNETKEALNFLNEKNLINFDDRQLNTINKNFSKENITSAIEKNLFKDMKSLLFHHEGSINKLNDILMHEKIIQNEYNNILGKIQNNESEINELIDFYSDYLKENKGFLIRNEILKTFLGKILISKEEKENLGDQEKFDEVFFGLITKMNSFKENIEVIQKNSGTFSKTLLLSLKEHYASIDEMLNEKIVIFLKNLFRTKRNFDRAEFDKILTLLKYLHNKDQYLKFVLNEYTQMRKKFIEEQLRGKYLKYSTKNYDEIFKNLNEDFIFFFMKEFILINYFFEIPYTPTEGNEKAENPKEISSILKEDSIFELLNLNETQMQSGEQIQKRHEEVEDMMKKISELYTSKDFEAYIVNLNSILYVFEDLFFQHTQKSDNFYEIYKITLLSYFYSEKIEAIFKENNMEGISLKLSIIISNYKKSYSMLFKKYANEGLKTLQKLKNNVISYLTDSQILITNETVINQTINKLIEQYIQIFELYNKYKITNDDKEIANPLQHEIYIFLVNFFNSEQIQKETNTEILFKVINLLSYLNSSLIKYDQFNIPKNEVLLKNLIEKVAEIIITNVFTAVKFESSLKESLSHEQTINLIEHMLEKVQLSLMNINIIKDYTVKEEIKSKMKERILQAYQDITNKESEINLGGLTEEEFKNYLDII